MTSFEFEHCHFVCLHQQLLVTRPDGTPASGERVIIEFRDYGQDQRFRKELTSDSRGSVVFTLPPIDVEVTSLSVQVCSIL